MQSLITENSNNTDHGHAKLFSGAFALANHSPQPLFITRNLFSLKWKNTSKSSVIQFYRPTIAPHLSFFLSPSLSLSLSRSLFLSFPLSVSLSLSLSPHWPTDWLAQLARSLARCHSNRSRLLEISRHTSRADLRPMIYCASIYHLGSGYSETLHHSWQTVIDRCSPPPLNEAVLRNIISNMCVFVCRPNRRCVIDYIQSISSRSENRKLYICVSGIQ